MKKYYLLLLLFLTAACGSPATQQMDVYGTAVVAQGQLQISNMLLTGTAQAPIIQITQTSAAFAFSQTQEAGFYTSTAMAWTPSPVPTATPNAAATLVMANAIAQATQLENGNQLSNLQVQRTRQTNTLRAMAGYVIGFVILVGGLVWAIGLAKKHSVYAVPMNDQGDKQAVIVDGILMDPDRMPNGMGEFTKTYVRSLPLITAERQDVVTNHDQMIDMKTRTRVTSAAVQKLLESQNVKFLPEPQGVESTPLRDDNFLLPSWEIINGWDGKNGLPYYTARGLEMIDIDQYPHLSAIGMTGMGKSRRFFRPLIACALAAGHRVVIIGKSADYWPFEGHPNATVIKVNKITQPDQAMRYARILESIVEEMNRRDDVLTDQRKSTWTHAGHERTFIVLDELGSALRLMGSSSPQARIWVEGLVAEGRKAGFNIVLANQRATGMASILSQTGKAIFRVESDEEKAHKSLTGASLLHDGYFLARFGMAKLAGAFEPSDDELIAFLRSRPVAELDKDDWVEGKWSTVTEQVTGGDDASGSAGSLPAEAIQPKLNVDDARRIVAEEDRIMELHEAGESDAAIVAAIWGVRGGGSLYTRKDQVQAVLAKYGASSSSSPVLGSKMGLQGA